MRASWCIRDCGSQVSSDRHCPGIVDRSCLFVNEHAQAHVKVFILLHVQTPGHVASPTHSQRNGLMALTVKSIIQTSFGEWKAVWA